MAAWDPVLEANAADAAVRFGRRARREIACPSRLRRNPYLKLLYDHLAQHGFAVVEEAHLSLRFLVRSRARVGFIHIHWPEHLYRHGRGRPAVRRARSWLKLVLFVQRLLAARLLGYRLVWTIHQVFPHDAPAGRRDRFIARLLVRLSDVLLAHDAATAEAARTELGVDPETVAHGSYVGVYAPGRARREVRAELAIPDDAFAFLSFGAIRPYKEIDILLEAFGRAALRNAVLVIAGDAKDERLIRLIEDAADADPRIKPMLGFVPDDRVAELFGACDAAVVSRGDGGTSGSLILALSLGLPVVAAEAPNYRELTDGYRAGWSFRPRDTLSLASALQHAASDAVAAYAKGRLALELADRLRWSDTAARIADLLRRAA